VNLNHRRLACVDHAEGIEVPEWPRLTGRFVREGRPDHRPTGAILTRSSCSCHKPGLHPDPARSFGATLKDSLCPGGSCPKTQPLGRWGVPRADWCAARGGFGRQRAVNRKNLCRIFLSIRLQSMVFRRIGWSDPLATPQDSHTPPIAPSDGREAALRPRPRPGAVGGRLHPSVRPRERGGSVHSYSSRK